MSQPAWTIVNGVKWSTLDSPSGGKRKRKRPTLWGPEIDVENPIPSFFHEGKEYKEICEISYEEALAFILR